MRKYWKILYNPDLNETGMFQNVMYVVTVWQGNNSQQGDTDIFLLEDWCYTKLGNKTAWVQGVAPTKQWSIYEITVSEFNEREPVKLNGICVNDTIRVVKLGIGKPHVYEIYTDEDLRYVKYSENDSIIPSSKTKNTSSDLPDPISPNDIRKSTIDKLNMKNIKSDMMYINYNLTEGKRKFNTLKDELKSNTDELVYIVTKFIEVGWIVEYIENYIDKSYDIDFFPNK